MPFNIPVQLAPPDLAVTMNLPPVDPYVASAGYNMLVQLTYRRIARYVDDTWQPEHLAVSVNATAVLAAVRAASGTSFVSDWLKSVQSGPPTATSQVAIQCRLAIHGVAPETTGRIAMRLNAMFAVVAFSTEGEGPWLKVNETPLGEFGPIVILAVAPMFANPDPTHAVATVTADLGAAVVSVDQAASSADGLWLSGTSVGKSIVTEIGQVIRGAGAIDLMPPLSPFGVLAGSNVFETFQVDVFPTTNPANAAAGLSVGFRLREASVASAPDVQSVAGFDDYGTIMDQWTLARVLQHRWAHGGFLKHLGYSGAGTVDLGDGHGAQDVQIWGAVDLNSLDQVTIVTDHELDRELDFIDLSGSCQVTIDKIKTLSDGKEQSLDHDNTFQSDWSFAAGIDPNPPPPTGPMAVAAQAFIDFASKATIQYLARPWRGVTQKVTTGVLDGVAGFLYATGRF
jgi:hypothetical protein